MILTKRRLERRAEREFESRLYSAVMNAFAGAGNSIILEELMSDVRFTRLNSSGPNEYYSTPAWSALEGIAAGITGSWRIQADTPLARVFRDIVRSGNPNSEVLVAMKDSKEPYLGIMVKAAMVGMEKKW